jgi:hypothetical protein
MQVAIPKRLEALHDILASQETKGNYSEEWCDSRSARLPLPSGSIDALHPIGSNCFGEEMS